MTTVDLKDFDWSPTGNDALFNPTSDDINDLLAVNPRDVRRAETAPMVLTILSADGTLCVGGLEDEVAPGEEYRYTEEYHELYYSKMPRDPRMLPPLTHRGRKANNGTIGEALAASTAEPAPGTQPAVVPFSTASTHAKAGAKAGGSEGRSGPASGRGAVGTDGATGRTPSASCASKLEEYIRNFRPDWGYAEIRGVLREFSGDQDGSRLVQRLIERPEVLPQMFDEVYENFEALTIDVFGNYVLQKLFESVPKAVRLAQLPAGAEGALDAAVAKSILEANMMPRLVEKVRGHLKEYSMNTYGCRVMQKALDNMDAKDRSQIIHEVEDCVTACVFDQNANHVIQKIVEVCPAESQFIIDAFLPQLHDLAYHAYGCRVLQRTFEMCCSVPEVNVVPLLEKVISCINEFTLHQYGNYVVQHAMLNAPPEIRARFVALLRPSLYALSCSKFASNVAEKAVCIASDEDREKIIVDLTKPLSESQGGNYLVLMMQDTYANYVVQRLIVNASPAQRARIGELVSPHVEAINASVYGRHLLRKMESMDVISAEFLRLKGIDVSTADYNGASAGGRGGKGGRGDHGHHSGNGRWAGGNGGAGGRARGGGHRGNHSNNGNNAHRENVGGALRGNSAGVGGGYTASNNSNNNNANANRGGANNNQSGAGGNGNHQPDAASVGQGSTMANPQMLQMPGAIYGQFSTQQQAAAQAPTMMAMPPGAYYQPPQPHAGPYMGYVAMDPAQQAQSFQAMFPAGYMQPMMQPATAPVPSSASGGGSSPGQMSLGVGGNYGGGASSPHQNNGTSGRRYNSNHGGGRRENANGDNTQRFSQQQQPQQQPQPQQPCFLNSGYGGQPQMMDGFMPQAYMPQPQQQVFMQPQPQEAFTANRGSDRSAGHSPNSNWGGSGARKQQGGGLYVPPHRTGAKGGARGAGNGEAYTATANAGANFAPAAY